MCTLAGANWNFARQTRTSYEALRRIVRDPTGLPAHHRPDFPRSLTYVKDRYANFLLPAFTCRKREFSIVPAIPHIRNRRPPALGHTAIDSDISAISDEWLRTANCEPSQFHFLIERLKLRMTKHFEHEAVLMERAGSILCRCHRDEHQSLLDLCDQMAGLSERSWRKTQSLLRLEFPKLLRKHVLYMDQLAVLFLNTAENPPLRAPATDPA